VTEQSSPDQNYCPYFEQLQVGQKIEHAPGLTLTTGHAAAHQAFVGDRLRLALDSELSAAVTGIRGELAHPALIWDVAIGQSTLVTQRVVANLFYRGLVFHRAPMIGDTLHTTTEVVGLRQNRPKPGRVATGMAVLRVQTIDQDGRPVLDFLRCAMLPLADPEANTGADDDLDALSREIDEDSMIAAIAGWRLDTYRQAVGGGDCGHMQDGRTWRLSGGDVVSSAPELARLTLNVANVHHDETQTGQRLVYGGHTIGIAAAQLTRMLPDLVTIVAWMGCDHLGPVMEGDTLTSAVELERSRRLPSGGTLVYLRSRVQAQHGSGSQSRAVLDWRLVGVMP
jgi:acyl dehydratase